jgi:hypothetical protein
MLSSWDESSGLVRQLLYDDVVVQLMESLSLFKRNERMFSYLSGICDDDFIFHTSSLEEVRGSKPM